MPPCRSRNRTAAGRPANHAASAASNRDAVTNEWKETGNSPPDDDGGGGGDEIEEEEEEENEGEGERRGAEQRARAGRV